MRRTRPWLMLALALASGGLAAFLALRYLREQATPLAAAPPKHAKLLIAARPVAVGTVLVEQDLKAIDWPVSALPLGYVTNGAGAVGRGAIAAIQENEPILESKLAPKGTGGGLPVVIEPGMRALTIAVNQVSGVAGFVTPNTRVDVLLTIDDNVNTTEPATRIIMQDVRTLAAGQSMQPDKDGKPQPVPVVTFLVTPEQAETLALASRKGSIQLALRNMLDTTEVRTAGTRVSSLLGGPIGRPVVPRRVSRPSPQTVAAPVPNETVVEVYRGGVRTLQKF